MSPLRFRKAQDTDLKVKPPGKDGDSPPTVADKIAILVLGMHRSGTSAITRVISLLGADLPSNLMPPVPGNNEAGFWESLDIYALNDEILASGGSSWSDWATFNPAWFHAAIKERFKEQALAILQRDFGNSALFVLKDPRICRLLPFWIEVFKEFGAVVKCVIPIRNPIEVADSLKQRDEFIPFKSYALWLRHVLDAELESRILDRSFCRYESLLSDWRDTVAKISSDLGFVWPRYSPVAEVEIDTFLNSRHRHHIREDEQISASETLPPWVKESFELLLEITANNVKDVNTQRLNELRIAFNQASTFLGPIAQAEEMKRLQVATACTNQVNEILNRNDELQGLTESLKSSIAAFEAQTVQKEIRLLELADLVNQLNTKNADLEDQVSQREAKLSELEAMAERLDSEKADLKVIIAQREARLLELEDLADHIKTRNAELVNQAASNESKLREFDGQVCKLLSRNSQFEDLINNLQGKVSELEERLSRNKQRTLELDNIINHNTTQIAEIKEIAHRRKYRIRLLKKHALKQNTDLRNFENVLLKKDEIIKEQNDFSIHQTAKITLLENLAGIRRSRINRLKQHINYIYHFCALFDSSLDNYNAIKQSGSFNSNFDYENLSLAEDLLKKAGDHTREQEILAAQRMERINALEIINAQIVQEKVKLSEIIAEQQCQIDQMEVQLTITQDEIEIPNESQRALAYKLNEIQLCPAWPLSLMLQSAYRRWPMLFKGVFSIFKITWWTLTLNLPSKLKLHREADIIAKHGLFDLGWYVIQNPDIILEGFNPLLHWLDKGWREGRNPNPLFDVKWYLENSPDVRQMDINPLIHYISNGANQGRFPHPLFDTTWYLDHNKDLLVSAINPLGHFLKAHPKASHDPHPLFDVAWYLNQYRDIDEAGINPLVDYLTRGADAGRNPNPFFDSSWYIRQYPNVRKQRLNPLVHYVRWGAAQGWNPSSFFDTTFYLAQHPQIAIAHINPLSHYLHTGIKLGWQTQPSQLSPTMVQTSSPPILDLSVSESNGMLSNLSPLDARMNVEGVANDNEIEILKDIFSKQSVPFRAFSKPSRLLIVDWKPPTPDRDSGSYRMSKILFCLTEAGCEVDFIGDKMPESEHYIDSLKKLSIKVVIGRLAAIQHLSEFGHQYRIAFLARPEIYGRYLPLIRAFSPFAKVLYDTVDLHWIRFKRSAVNGKTIDEKNELIERASHYKCIELSNARSADITLAITNEERSILLDEDPSLHVELLPNIHEVHETSSPFSSRKDIFFIGGFDHEPNIDAVNYYASSILPLVREKLPGVRLHVVGSNMPDAIRGMASAELIPVGYVADVEPYFNQCRVFIAPLRHGAGMKGKIGQSLSFGLPIVTTPIGAEGLGLIDGFSALIRSDPVEFSNAIVSLYTDESLWQFLADNGLELIKGQFSIEAVRPHLLSLVSGD